MAAAAGSGIRMEGVFHLVKTDLDRLEEFRREGGDTHPFYHLLSTYVTDSNTDEKTNADYLAAVNAAPMPGLVKHLLYTIAKPADAGWGWSESHMKDERVALVKASQLVLNPPALLQHAIENDFDTEHMRMIIDHVEDHMPSIKGTILRLFWEVSGRPEGDPNWAWNHLGASDENREHLKTTLRMVFGDEDWGDAYRARKSMLHATFGERKGAPDSKFTFKANGDSIATGDHAIPKCIGYGSTSPYMFGFYEVRDDGNVVYPSYSKVSIRLPSDMRSQLPLSVRRVLFENGVSAVKIFADVTDIGLPQYRPGGDEVNFFSHHIVNNEVTDPVHTDKKKFPFMGIFDAGGVGPKESDHGPMPFGKLEKREVYSHNVGGDTLAYSPKTAMFSMEGDDAEFWSVIIMDHGTEGTHRKVALVGQHRLVAGAGDLGINSGMTIAELATLPHAPSILSVVPGVKKEAAAKKGAASGGGATG